MSCSKYRGNCPSIIVKEEVIIEQIKSTIKKLVIPKELLEEFQQHMLASHEAKKQYHNGKIESLNKEYQFIQSKLETLLDMRISQSITENEYDRKASELKQRQYEINEQQKQYTVADEQFAITLSYLINLASRAYELFESSKVAQKRQLLGFLLSNLTLRGKKLDYTLKNPFNLFPAIQNRSRWLGDRDLNPDSRLQRAVSYH